MRRHGPVPHRAPGRATAVAGPLAALAAAVAVVVLVGAVDPNAPGHYPTCPFLAVTGWYCPGCGSLRAIHALAHGDLALAMARNPMTVLAGFALALTWVRWAARRVRAAPRTSAAPGWAVWGLAVAVLAFGVARNLPGATWLAP